MNRWTGELSVGYWRVRRYFLNDHRVVNTPRYDALRNQFYNELWQDTAAAMGAIIEDIGCGYSRISIGDKYTFVQGGKVQLDDHLILKIAGNKPLVYSMLTDRGVSGSAVFGIQSCNRWTKPGNSFGNRRRPVW